MKDKLFSRSYIAACIAGFLMSFAFFLLVPALPFYLRTTFGIGHTMIGVVLSCYVVAVLSIRPLAGFMADALPRKKVYIVAYALFAASFIGYFFITKALILFIFLRVIHGLAFGTLTTASNTLVIDIMPSSRRGEGLGYFGVMNNLAMAIGPMTGLFIVGQGNFTALFATSLISGIVGLIVASTIHAPAKPTSDKVVRTLSFDRFFLIKGIPACVVFFLLAIPYGMTMNYMALYASEVGISINSGLFFTAMALGMIASRLNSGRRVDKGLITETIRNGMLIALLGATGESLLATAAECNLILGNIVYFLAALLFGYGFGTIFPAFNTLFINLAPNSQRATANATYLTGWDVGIGAGMLFGGVLAEMGYQFCYTFGGVLIIIALILFVQWVTPHFSANRLR